jgi:hypothetical protein
MVLSKENVTGGIIPVRRRMSSKARHEYLELMQGHYGPAGRRQRSVLLDEMERVTGLDRKTLIRLMGKSDLRRRPRSRERGRTYGLDVQYALRVIAESLDYICAERLHGNLTWMAEHLARHGELRWTEQLGKQLDRISVSTIRRLLRGMHKDEYYLPRPKPRPANSITRAIPMKRLPWNETEPGYFEVDLVFHCGSDARGEFACSLHMVDVATGWSEIAAVLGRSQLVIGDAFQRILARLPFPILGLHPDNGSEFFNHHLMRFWQKQAPALSWSRSRPYHKNDNRFVEQKNSSIVRSRLGYQRLDTVEQVKAMNCLYGKLRLYYNLFQPVLRMSRKEILPQADGTSRVRHRYGPARTPFHRLCATEAVSQEEREALSQLRTRTNPRSLRVGTRQLADAILRMPNAAKSAEAQNVYLTLFRPHAVGATAPVTFSFDRTEALR